MGYNGSCILLGKGLTYTYNNSHLNLQGEDKYLEAISTTHGYHEGTLYTVAIISDAHLGVIDVVDLIKYYPLHISDHIRTIVQHGPEGNSPTTKG